MKNILMTAVAVFAFTISVSAFDKAHWQEFYTVKIMAAHEKHSDKCEQMCETMKKDGLMTFCAAISGMHTAMAGIYTDEKQAREASAALGKKYGIPCGVMKTFMVSATECSVGRIINAPSGIWLQKNNVNTKIFSYGLCCDAMKTTVDNKVSVSPSGKEIVFYFNGAIHKLNIVTGAGTVIAANVKNPGAVCRPDPKWSPDGKQVAYIVEYGPGKGAGIKMINGDGKEETMLLDNSRSNLHVASFEWAAENNDIYFVAADGRRRVPVDGKLCLLGTAGKVTDIVPAAAGKMVDKHFKIQKKSIIITENTYASGLDDNYVSNEKTINLN